jgi:hypothetical protein
MASIFEWPRDWYQFSTVTLRLRARSQTSDRPWAGTRSVLGPHAQVWIGSFAAIAQDLDDGPGQSMIAFFSRLAGQSGLLRIGDPSRRAPHFNRTAAFGRESWSDNTFFDDGRGWLSGLLPDFAYLANAAAAGDRFVVIGGLPASTARALRRGDLLELRPNGIPTDVGNLYEVMVDGHTDANGRTGIEIRPALRQGFASGDMVLLSYPTSVFRLIDDDQGSHQVESPARSSVGFSVVEYLG